MSRHQTKTKWDCKKYKEKSVVCFSLEATNADSNIKMW